MTDSITPAPLTPADAEAALATARAARSAAQEARSIPPWHAPVSGLLLAATFTGLAVTSAHPDSWVWLNLVFGACALGFLALNVATTRAGGILLWPTLTLKERWLRQVPFLVASALAYLVGQFLGLPAGLAVFGVVGGALVWYQTEQRRKSIA